MKTFRLFVVAWMLLWLAVTGAIAAAMPLCAHDAEHSPARVVQHRHNHTSHQAPAHQHQAEAAQAANGAGQTSFFSFICDNCDLCHLASSVVPPAAVTDFLPPADRLYEQHLGTIYPFPFLEQPQRPPLPLLA